MALPIANLPGAAMIEFDWTEYCKILTYSGIQEHLPNVSIILYEPANCYRRLVAVLLISH
jgi:hypothetical protein